MAVSSDAYITLYEIVELSFKLVCVTFLVVVKYSLDDVPHGASSGVGLDDDVEDPQCDGTVDP